LFKKIFKILILITFFLNFSIVLYLFFFTQDFNFIINRLGSYFYLTNLSLIEWGLVYVAVIAFNIPLSMFITMICGALFGPLKTFFVLVVASPAGCTIAFIINKFFFKQTQKTEYIKKKLKLNSNIINYKTILFFRIFPIIPFTWINIISSSFKNISAFKYFLINLIGCPLNILIFSNLGNSIYQVDIKKSLTITSILLLFILVTFILKKNYFKK
jgi:uncharacterized membrane protein YdjX (TVP38/TMEM64 family)